MVLNSDLGVEVWRAWQVQGRGGRETSLMISKDLIGDKGQFFKIT